ncbi:MULTISPECIES: glycine zipper 2TM domain-containing protein [unclassified Marinobacterium]|uniref:glycine zipper 2TM domain-containing protein n=1 Tax=unclassified Marinobacterium TaxID=2644139 RepID=UPI001569A53E|nr:MULTISPECIES: glycine zipper 2TM domain-containing protein [unclassified Marinobacterium]NRP10047.1 Outer membrane lipoprotein SlyB precursor [Marinobacterium sp. xm-g-48]NRP60611.1 Outer membrane lipoprotein SlyB precursor [Marinobacterium sp. xm-d-564]NRP82892.1 Outer membrane lipoprotein SlyB precursor [Marinobacterium sp. xm-d-509]
MRMNRVLIGAVAAVALTGCMQQNLQGTAYTAADARQVQTVEYATVEQVTPVIINGDPNNPVGVGAGAIVGGIAGSTIGGGKGSSIATVLGAVAGGIAGSKIQENSSQTQGQEIQLLMDKGGRISIVQGVQNNLFFRPGDKVRVLRSGNIVRVSY